MTLKSYNVRTRNAYGYAKGMLSIRVAARNAEEARQIVRHHYQGEPVSVSRSPYAIGVSERSVWAAVVR